MSTITGTSLSAMAQQQKLQLFSKHVKHVGCSSCCCCCFCYCHGSGVCLLKALGDTVQTVRARRQAEIEAALAAANEPERRRLRRPGRDASVARGQILHVAQEREGRRREEVREHRQHLPPPLCLKPAELLTMHNCKQGWVRFRACLRVRNALQR